MINRFIFGYGVVIIPHHKKVTGYYVISSEPFECPSVHPSFHSYVRPSISTSFPDSNLSSFWLIFFKLCMDIDIWEEWFGIANGPKFMCKQQSYGPWLMQNCVFPQYLQNKWMNFDKIFVYALIYTRSLLYLMPVSFGNRVMALDLWISIKFCIGIDIDNV